MKRNIFEMFERMGYATALQLAHANEQLRAATTRANDLEQQIASKEAELVDARAQLARCISERDLAAKYTDRESRRVEALKRRRGRLEAELRKVQDQLAGADVSGRIRDLEDEKARLQQQLADLQSYFEQKQGLGNPYHP